MCEGPIYIIEILLHPSTIYAHFSYSPGSGLLCKLRPSGMDLQEAWRESFRAPKSTGSRNRGHTCKAGQRVQQSMATNLGPKNAGTFARGCTTFPARNGLLANLRSMADEFCAGKKLRCMRHGTAGSPWPAQSAW